MNIRNRSYAISAEVTIDTPDASGVLFAHGSRFGGHALYIKDGKLKYDYNWVGEFDQYVESSKPVPTGDCVLSASFEKSGSGMPTEGMLSLYINQEKVGEAKIKTQPGKFSLAGEGLNVGQDRAEPVTDDYPGEVALGVHRGNDPQGHRRRRRRPVGRPREGGRRRRSHATDGRTAGARAPPAPRREDQGSHHARQRSAAQLAGVRSEDRDPRVRRLRHPARRFLCAAGGSDRDLRQRRHALVREAPVRAGRVHLPSLEGNGRGRPGQGEQQPYKALVDHDRAWLAHSARPRSRPDQGRHRGVRGITVEAFEQAVQEFFATATHPTLGLPYTKLGYQPMRELLDLLERARLHRLHLFGRRTRLHPTRLAADVRRPPRARDRLGNDGSSTATASSTAPSDVEQPIDDGTGKPEHIWMRTGRKPLLAGGNADGDVADARDRPASAS